MMPKGTKNQQDKSPMHDNGRQSNGADNPYLIMSDRSAAQSMAQQKARCLIFNGSVWRAVQAPPANPPSPLKALNPLPAPAIVCRLLPLYSPLLSASLVTINGYFALKKRPLQKIPQIFRPTTLEMLIMKKRI